MKTLDQSQRTGSRIARLALFAALSASAVLAQDPGGDTLLNGTFRFRYVATLNYGSTGFVSEVAAAEGVITFQGNGNYLIGTGSQYNDNTISGGKFQTFPANTTGTYAINTAGVGAITNPLLQNGLIYGTFTNGVFVGSSTESGVNDLFIAILPGAPPTNSTFTSPYWLGALDFTIGGDGDLKNALFKINPNGSGGLGTLTIKGQANNQNGVALTQTSTGATYNFATDGNASLNIPAPSGVATAAVMVSGARNLYVSADGNYVLGWTPNNSSGAGAYDILFGVKALTGTATDGMFTGDYYISGLGDQPPIASTQTCSTFSFWGSEAADGMQNEIVHQRLYWPSCANFNDNNGNPLEFDYGTWDETIVNSDGTATDSPLSLVFLLGSTYGFGASGNSFIGISNTAGTQGLTIGIRAPSVPATSAVYLNPIGVVNAASWDGPTASIAPGELLTLLGTNLSSTTLISTGGQAFPTQLGNVQVTIGGFLAPIYYVSSTQISVIAPYELATSIANGASTATIQVINNTVSSNPIAAYLLTDANSGFFTTAANGIGYAIAHHPPTGGSLPVTEANPAQPGEVIVLVLTGMGTVTPTIPDGAVPSTTTLSNADIQTNGELEIFFDDPNNGYSPGAIAFAGLAPGLAGLYQLNLQIPATGVGPGDVFLEVVSGYSDVEQVYIPVGSGTTAATTAATAAANPDAHPQGTPVRPRRTPRTPRMLPGAALHNAPIRVPHIIQPSVSPQDK